MAQLTTASVTYTQVDAVASPGSPLAERIFTLSFGDSTATYTNGGIPLVKANLGCPQTIRYLTVVGCIGGGGNIPVFNYTANTIQLFRDGNVTVSTAGALVEMLTSAAVPATTLRVKVEGY